MSHPAAHGWRARILARPMTLHGVEKRSRNLLIEDFGWPSEGRESGRVFV